MMTRFLLTLFLSAFVCFGQTNISVVYSFVNGLGQTQIVKQVSFQPFYLNSLSKSYVVGDEVKRVVTTSQFTNPMISGLSYLVKYYSTIQPPTVTLQFTNYFPTNISGTVYAVDYTTISTNLGSGIYAYSQAQADARFAPIGSSGGTTYTFSNTNLPAGVVVTNGAAVAVGTNTSGLVTTNDTRALNLTNSGNVFGGSFNNGHAAITTDATASFVNGAFVLNDSDPAYGDGNATILTINHDDALVVSDGDTSLSILGNTLIGRNNSAIATWSISDLGAINALSFTGNGSGLTNLNASQLTGVVPTTVRISPSSITNDGTQFPMGTVTSGTTNLAGALIATNAVGQRLYSFNGGSLTNLDATKLTGTVPSGNLPALNYVASTNGTAVNPTLNNPTFTGTATNLCPIIYWDVIRGASGTFATNQYNYIAYGTAQGTTTRARHRQRIPWSGNLLSAHASASVFNTWGTNNDLVLILETNDVQCVSVRLFGSAASQTAIFTDTNFASPISIVGGTNSTFNLCVSNTTTGTAQSVNYGIGLSFRVQITTP